MTEQSIGIAAAGDKDKAIATLELAFAADPVMRWFWPDAAVYRATFSKFVGAIAGGAFEQGTALWHDDGHAVALWLAPGFKSDDDALLPIMLESVEPGLLTDLSAFADIIGEHHPVVDHWYLPITGVDPFVQGRGFGSMLLHHASRRVISKSCRRTSRRQLCGAGSSMNDTDSGRPVRSRSEPLRGSGR